MSFLFGKRHAAQAQATDNPELLAHVAAIDRSMAVIEFQLDGTILSANQNFLALVGYTRDELVGRNYSILVEPAQRDSAAYKEFWDKLGRGEFHQVPCKCVGKGGKEVWLQASYTPVQGPAGEAVKVIGFATDITAQQQSEQSHSALKNVLESVGAMIMATDMNRNIIYVNRAAHEMMRGAQAEIRTALPTFDADQLMGANIDVFHRHPAYQRDMLNSLTGTHDAQIEVGTKPLGLEVNPMFGEGGARIGSVVVWTDRSAGVRTETEVENAITAVIAGDLKSRVEVSGHSGFHDSLAVKINELIESFALVVGNVKTAAGELARGVQEISQGNEDLSTRTESQASSLEETASSMEEMTASVRQNADNSGQANQLAAAARDQADKGGAVVARAVKAMGEINQSSKKIADIIGVIDEIAFQTNLLALNAAVEAARAGEQGRGFAVVASEVRNLAGRSATAAKEIKDLIRDSLQKVDEGSTLVSQSGQTLDQIVGAVKKVSDIIAEIAASSHEQSSGIEQVNKAVMQLDEMTQQNAALVEQATAASKSMADQARALSDGLSNYRLAGESATASAVPSRQAASRPAPARPQHQPLKAVAPPRKAAKPALLPEPQAKAPKAAVGDDSTWTQF
jgi:methyl-accepting chemotaxis protein